MCLHAGVGSFGTASEEDLIFILTLEINGYKSEIIEDVKLEVH